MKYPNGSHQEKNTTEHGERRGRSQSTCKNRIPPDYHPASWLLAMAFPIPDHLPRRAIPQDISSKILSKVGDATNKNLNAALAETWLEELDETIQNTKVCWLNGWGKLLLSDWKQ
jgi:hypothetical protein